MKQKITLSEHELHNLISESVKRVLNEQQQQQSEAQLIQTLNQLKAQEKPISAKFMELATQLMSLQPGSQEYASVNSQMVPLGKQLQQLDTQIMNITTQLNNIAQQTLTDLQGKFVKYGATQV